jgi:hypothetical protein
MFTDPRSWITSEQLALEVIFTSVRYHQVLLRSLRIESAIGGGLSAQASYEMQEYILLVLPERKLPEVPNSRERQLAAELT